MSRPVAPQECDQVALLPARDDRIDAAMDTRGTVLVVLDTMGAVVDVAVDTTTVVV